MYYEQTQIQVSFDKLLSELFLKLSPDRNMISDFGFQEHIQLLKLDVLLGTDFCQTRTTLCYFVTKINYLWSVPIIAAAYSIFLCRLCCLLSKKNWKGIFVGECLLSRKGVKGSKPWHPKCPLNGMDFSSSSTPLKCSTCHRDYEMPRRCRIKSDVMTFCFLI